MDSKSLYDQIILRAKLRDRDPNIYYERHHILPKSMGGDNSENNLVYLTAKEHFVAHHLLWKIYRNKEMSHAFMLMCSVTRGGEKFSISAKEYEVLKEDNRRFRSEFMSSRPGNNLGKVLPQEWKDNIAKAQRGNSNSKGKESSFKGKTHSDETKELISQKRKGVATRTGIPFSEESKKKMSENRKGKPKAKWSDERKAARSEMMKQLHQKRREEKSPD